MKISKCYTIATLLIIACHASAGVQPERPSTPVRVINDSTTPVPVTVQNPQTSVTIDNSVADPVPVTLPAPVSVKNINYRYEGTSSVDTFPNIGARGMDLLCQDSYGIDARMCDSKEFFDTPAHAMPSVQSAWIWPHIISAFYNTSSNRVDYLVYPDEIANIGDGVPTCRTWRITATPPGSKLTTGTLLGWAADGSNATVETTASCLNKHPVACCVPR